jgi:uncharacterized membrane protein YoaK (UPF0700 family)
MFPTFLRQFYGRDSGFCSFTVASGNSCQAATQLIGQMYQELAMTVFPAVPYALKDIIENFLRISFWQERENALMWWRLKVIIFYACFLGDICTVNETHTLSAPLRVFIEASFVEFHISMSTAWSRVLLEKLAGRQLVKKFSAFYGTRMFITAFTRARH